MSKDQLNETLAAIAKSPEPFYRDTGMIFKTLDNLQRINRELKAAIKAGATKQDETK